MVYIYTEVRMKTCIKCGQLKEIDFFYKTSGNSCKSCHNKETVANGKKNPEQRARIARDWYHRHPDNAKSSIESALKWQAANPEKVTFSLLKSQLKRYGLTPEKFWEMEKTQNGKCAICDQVPSRRLDVDHNHNTGKVRALLCSNHNTLIGLANEDIKILQATIEYLQKYQDDSSGAVV